jgi:hypothetical protein
MPSRPQGLAFSSGHTATVEAMRLSRRSRFASLFKFFRRHLHGVPARHERGEADGKLQKCVGHAGLQHDSTGPVL